MWTSIVSVNDLYRPPVLSEDQRKALPSQFLGVIYLSLEIGIIWNFLGKEYPEPKEWVWATPDKKRIIDYIDSLWAQKFLPVLYGPHVSKEVAEEVVSEFQVHPPVFLGLKLDVVSHIVATSWMGSTGKIPSVGFTIAPGAQIFHMDPTFSGGTYVTLENIGFDPLLDLPISQEKVVDVDGEEKMMHKPYMLILVGQPGSGKSTIATKLSQNHFFYLVDEKKAGSIRRAISSTRSRIIAEFKEIIKSTMSRKFMGIVIDSTNPSLTHRNVYINIAKEMGIPYYVGWVTRPGWAYNRKRNFPVPDIALRTYRDNLDLPIDDVRTKSRSDDGTAIRLV